MAKFEDILDAKLTKANSFVIATHKQQLINKFCNYIIHHVKSAVIKNEKILNTSYRWRRGYWLILFFALSERGFYSTVIDNVCNSSKSVFSQIKKFGKKI